MKNQSIHTTNKQLNLTPLFKGSILSVAISLAINLNAEELADGADFDGETMVVSGSRIEQKLEDTTGSVSVVTAQDIEQFMMTDLEALFRYEPGITTTGSGAQPQTITVRGVGGNRLVYIKDGRRSNDGYAGGGGYIVGRSYFSTDTVQQIEVAKGAASSLYGSDGLGGIIVISTKDPEDYLREEQQHLALSLAYDGAADESRLDVSGAAEMGKWAFSGAISHTDGKEVQNYDESLPGYDSDSDAALLKAVRQIDKFQKIKFTLDHFQQDIEQIITANANETLDKDRTTAFSIDYHNESASTLWDSTDLQVYVSQYEQKSEQIAANTRGYIDYNDYRFEQDIWGVRAVFAKSIETQNSQHQLVYGIDHDQYDTTRPRLKTRILADGTVDFSDEPQKAFPGAETRLTGVFLQNNLSWQDSSWSAVLGGRLDIFKMEPKQDALYDDAELTPIDETAFSPKLGLIYKASELTSYYLQYVEGFKIPPHDQAYQSHGVEPFYQILPNSDLQSEESQTLEAGIRFNGNGLSVEMNAYFSEFDNFIESTLVGLEDTYIPGVSKQLFQYQNIDQTRIKGVELKFKQNLTQALDWNVNLAWAKGENLENGQALTSMSPLSGSVLLNAAWQDWQFTGAMRFAKAMTDVPSDSEGNSLISSKGFAVFDVYAVYQGQSWQLSAGVENLFDKEYAPYESVAGMASDAEISQYTQSGRTLSMRLNYQF